MANDEKFSKETTSEHIVQPASEFIQAKVLQNADLSINRLPIEILLTIISLTGFPSLERPYPWLLFSWVCHHWRMIISSHAMFWKALVFRQRNDMPRSLVKSILERSEGVPLSINITKTTPMKVQAVIRSLPKADRHRVETLYVGKFTGRYSPCFSLSKLLFWLPSLKNLFSDVYVVDPSGSFNSSHTPPRLKAMQIRISKMDNLSVLGCFLELRWLKLKYCPFSAPLFSVLEAVQSLPNLEFLFLFAEAETWYDPNTTNYVISKRLMFPKLTTLVGDCRILDIITAPALSYLTVGGDPNSVEPGAYSYPCGFNTSEINHIGLLCRPLPCIVGFQNGSVENGHHDASKLEDDTSFFKRDHSLQTSIFDTFPASYPNRFFFLSRSWNEGGLGHSLPVAIASIQSVTNLDEITLVVRRFQYLPKDEVIAILKAATTVRRLTTLISRLGFMVFCDILKDGDICPRLEKLTYVSRNEDANEPTMESFSLEILQHLQTLMAVRSRTISGLNPLKTVELRDCVRIRPQDLKEIEQLGLRVIQTNERT